MKWKINLLRMYLPPTTNVILVLVTGDRRSGDNTKILLNYCWLLAE